MSTTGGSQSLLGHENELPTQRWKQENKTRKPNSRCRVSFVVTLALVLLTTFLVSYLHWNVIFKLPATKLAEAPNTVPPAPERDLKKFCHPEEHVSREASIRLLSWTITSAIIAPDGVEKEVLLINDQFPGPTIEARSGDTLKIEVCNLAEVDLTLHWHGLHMRGANDMDGPVGITQSAIKAGGNFTYRVPIGNQAGTFWYHAHSEVQRADGLWGGLVVHNPAVLESVSYQYDYELLFLVGDWYHRPGQDILASFMDRTSLGIEPAPDSLLVNGIGSFKCSMATHGSPVHCSRVEKPWLTLDKQYRYRIRLVNVGSLTGLSFTIPDSEMKVIQVDGGQAVVDESVSVNSVAVLYPAQRVDFIMEWPSSTRDSDTKIIIELDNEYFLRPNFALTPIQSFLVLPQSASRRPSTNETEIRQFNLREAHGPLLDKPLPDPSKAFMIYTTVEILNHEGQRPKGVINHTHWEPQKIPLIALNRGNWDEHQLVPWTGSMPIWVELTINNIDTSGHPFHLHGFDFYVVASYEGKGGWDYYNPFKSNPPRGGPFNVVNPIRKDTVYVPPWGYVVIRFLADNPGIWALHCHVLWHAASGMSMAFQVLGDELTGFSYEDVESAA